MTLIAEKRLQMAVQRLGLRVIADRHAGRATGKYLLRPASDARRVANPAHGSYCLAPFWEWGRRDIGSRMSFDEVERFLASYKIAPTSPRKSNNALGWPSERPQWDGRGRVLTLAYAAFPER
jgi:hypothetical protein